MHGKNLGGRPRGTHDNTVSTGVIVRIVRDMGIREDAISDLLPGDSRQRREKANYAEDKIPGRSRKDRKTARQEQKANLKSAETVKTDVTFYEMADALCVRGLVAPADQMAARRLIAALAAAELSMLGWVNVLSEAAREHPDAITPYGTRMADDAAVAIADFQVLLEELASRIGKLTNLLEPLQERVRHLAYGGAGKDYEETAQGSVLPWSRLTGEAEPVDTIWLERFTEEADGKLQRVAPAAEKLESGWLGNDASPEIRFQEICGQAMALYMVGSDDQHSSMPVCWPPARKRNRSGSWRMAA
jgi:hypothetical protein